MQRLVLAIAVSALALGTVPAAAGSVPYDLETSFGPVHLEVNAATGHVHGTYPKYDCEIFGDLTQVDRIDGIWVQPRGDHPCHETRHGTANWGRLLFENPHGPKMSGWWSYCDREPTEAWNGHFLK